MTEFLRKLKWLAQRRRKEDELREELQFHIDEEADQQGLPEVEARRELGNLTRLREETRSAWGWTLLEQFAQDLRYAFRTMRASKLFSVLAILSLGLGIGANTAIYSFMDAILLRSLPVADPESLVVLNWHSRQVAQWHSFVMHSISGSTFDDPKSGTVAGIFPYPAYELFQKNDSIFSSAFAYHPAFDLNVTFKGQADVANGEYVSGDYFRGLAVNPAAGRLIIPVDDRAGAPEIA
ncbi:MAG: permease prefix domain 1-containing protein, partial [Bryobacteraceae bacterium]